MRVAAAGKGRPSMATRTSPYAGEPRASWLHKAESVLLSLAALLIAWATLSIAVSVFARFLFNRPLAWTIELSEYSLLYLTFFAAPAIARSRDHVRLEILTELARPSLVRRLDLIGLALGAIVGGVVAGAATYVSIVDYLNGAQLDKLLPIPRWAVVGGIALGMALFTLEQVRQFVRLLRGQPLDAIPPQSRDASDDRAIDSGGTYAEEDG